jgi:hypothetical protein
MYRADNNCVVQSAPRNLGIKMRASIADGIELAFNISDQYLYSLSFHMLHLA